MSASTPLNTADKQAFNANKMSGCVEAESASPSPNLLVVEDDLALQEAIVDTLELAGFKVFAVPSGEDALVSLGKQRFDMVISDVNMGGMDGHELLEQIKKDLPFLPVLLVTAYATIDRSVRAIQSGAVDYLVKPFEPGALIDLVHRHTIGKSLDDASPIVAAEVSRDLFQLAKRVAVTDSTVLISGESGTGKEVIARYIHVHSSRKDQPFVAINCAAIPETMLEATLFGHEKGAFTGAHQSAPGKFEQANGGTLLLDEVSEMDLSLQAKLLRVLQEREVERVGGRKLITLDVRIIATTNRNLNEYVSDGRFREDLFYRLSVFPIRWPALRDRIDDVLPIAEHLLQQHAQKMGRGKVVFSAEAGQHLLSYHWPGNVRELDNIVQRALILQSGATIYPKDLLFDSNNHSPAVRANNADSVHYTNTDTNTQPLTRHTLNDNAAQQLFAVNTSSLNTVSSSNLSTATSSISNDIKSTVGDAILGEDLKQREYEIILDALNATRGSRKDAAEKLGISPRTLRYKMAKMRDSGIAVE